MGAVCEICEKDMLKAKGCLDKDYVIDGERIACIPYFAEEFLGETYDTCGDCGAKHGQPHHTGCDMEECPSCGLQFIGCDCDVSEEMYIFPKGRKKVKK